MIYHGVESWLKIILLFGVNRFWMTFGQEYLTHLRMIQRYQYGAYRSYYVQQGEIMPIQFLISNFKSGDIGKNYTGDLYRFVSAFRYWKDERNLLIMCIIIAAIMLPISKPEHRVKLYHGRSC